ncbi:MAG TPA: thiamine-phosphate kinase [Thermomicrobiales bacterium]|nr:thiamine-phosphate kinase [Thermomicrobiales bacterium]
MSETVREIGEFGLIDRLQAVLREEMGQRARIILGIGDDAAIWRPAEGTSSVITTDTLVEGVHFRRDWTDWRSLGHKMLAVNLSDIAGMGAKPVLATVTLSLAGDELVTDLEEIYRGVAALAEPHDVEIAGGDIVRTPGPLTLTVTAIGEGLRLLRRSGARVGDRIAVSGTLGASAAGLRLLSGENPHLRQAATADLLIAAHLRPNPRIALGQMLAREGATAAMDLSDGLLGDLPKLLAASGVAARIETERVPVLPAVHALFPDIWQALTMRGGEDYELLVTLPASDADRIVADARKIGATLTVIGEIVSQEDGEPLLTIIEPDGRLVGVEPGAWDHFR